MGDVSKDFNRAEFRCRCFSCGFDTVDVDLLEILQSIRSYFRRPTIINSGCRCKTHNENIGGSETSYHMIGQAADIWIKDVKPEEIAFYVNQEYPGKYGIIIHDDFVHLDIRKDIFRDDNRT